VVEKILKAQGKWNKTVEKFNQINREHAETSNDIHT